MSPSQFRVLVAVAEHRSFSRAASELRQTQPAVSKTIRLLEQAFGGPLLVRGADGVTATALGDDVLCHARSALREFDALRQMASDHGGAVKGAIKIGAPPSLVNWPLPRILGALRKRHPEVHVRLFEGESGELTSWLGEHIVHVALATAPVEGWDWTALAEEPFMLLVRRDEAAGARALADIAGLPLIVSSCGIDRMLVREFEKHDLACAVTHRSRSYSTIYAMVEEGLGVSILPRSLALQAPPQLAAVPILGAPQRTIGILTPPVQTRVIRAFAAEATAVVAQG
ncbi:LysR family transcriptional regulator [Sphingomonas mali]|uniref:LysR family transcriptional regulator n=1 Tax=Sphingomonas mali TaxID=40682 RepID=UPI00082A1ACC|nr:LysR family transcriptional regulator [Sphingomonas mali]